jgi:O-antigen ligase
MVGYMVVILVGACTAPVFEVSWQTVEPMTKTFLPILAGATLIDSIPKLRQLVWVIVISQGYLAYEFNLRYYNTVFIPEEFTHAGLDNNSIAITMVTSVGLAFFLGLHSSRWWQKLLAFGLAALMAHVVLFSNSRGGMLSLIVTVAACFILTPKRPLDYLLLLVGVIVLIRLAGPSVQERFMTSFDEKGDRGEGRLEFWWGCTQALVQHPLGVGPNHWPVVAPLYGLPARPAHSTWFQMGAELGWPGLFCLFGIYGMTVIRLWPLMSKQTPVPDPWVRYLARMVIASIIGYVTSAQFVTLDGVELPYYVALIGAGTLRVVSTWAPADVQLTMPAARPEFSYA